MLGLSSWIIKSESDTSQIAQQDFNLWHKKEYKFQHYTSTFILSLIFSFKPLRKKAIDQSAKHHSHDIQLIYLSNWLLRLIFWGLLKKRFLKCLLGTQYSLCSKILKGFKHYCSYAHTSDIYSSAPVSFNFAPYFLQHSLGKKNWSVQVSWY